MGQNLFFPFSFKLPSFQGKQKNMKLPQTFNAIHLKTSYCFTRPKTIWGKYKHVLLYFYDTFVICIYLNYLCLALSLGQVTAPSIPPRGISWNSKPHPQDSHKVYTKHTPPFKKIVPERNGRLKSKHHNSAELSFCMYATSIHKCLINT